MDDWDVFFYDEENDCVSSLSTYHQLHLSIEPLVEAHPHVIYFFAKLEMHKDWDFNEIAMPEPKVIEKGDIIHMSLDATPNAWGEAVHVKKHEHEED